jgi:putative transposase
VNGEWLFDDVAKEVLRRQLWQIAEFCGLQILTHTILSNHFHVVVRVPQATPITDAELLCRHRVLYPQPTAWQPAQLAVIAAQLAANGPDAVAWRQRQLRLMGDVSQFMKLVKQRFSIWFNRAHQRFGPLWCDRFKSTLIGPGLPEVMVTYVDLNCVRAGIVEDPKDYRFCGYAEAVAGKAEARAGLRQVFDGHDWPAVQAAYRERLFGIGGTPRAAKAHISLAHVQQVFAAGGVLPLATLLRCRLRYLTDGVVLGTHAFVAAHLPATRRRRPRDLPRWSHESNFAVLRAVRSPAIG